MAFAVYTETCDHPNTSETQQFITRPATGTLGFAIYIYTKVLLKNRALVDSLMVFLPFPLNPTYTGTFILLLLKQR